MTLTPEEEKKIKLKLLDELKSSIGGNTLAGLDKDCEEEPEMDEPEAEEDDEESEAKRLMELLSK